ncbi:MAG: tetratricopeptide repeat protein, partial [Nitrospinae bacterium]|nr:tetratricopeptide repeat protein [Nitrospinota bacterium]
MRTDNALLTTVAILALAVAAVYAHTLGYPFHFDDDGVLVRRGNFANPFALDAIWSESPARFLTYESFALSHFFHGLWSPGYRLVNLLLHFGSAVVLWRLALLLRDRLLPDERGIGWRLFPLTAALLFVVHPLQTQGVVYIWQRSVTLATFLYLLSLFLYLSWALRRERGEEADRLFTAALVVGLMAMFAKQIAVTLPVAAVAADYFFVARSWERMRPRAGKVLLFALLAAVIPLLTLAADAGEWQDMRMRRHLGLSPVDYWLTQIPVSFRYLSMLLWPTGQSFDPPIPPINGVLDLAPGVVAHLLLVGAAFALRRRNPLFTGGVVFFYLALSVESLTPLVDPVFEHRMYLPMAGMALAVASWGAVAQKGSLVTTALMVAIVALGVAAHRRTLVWQSPETLWQDAALTNPTGYHTNIMLGQYYVEHDDPDRALGHYRIVQESHPAASLAPFMAGRILAEKGDLVGAAREYAEAARRSPDSPVPLNRLGETLLALNDYSGAERA